MDLLNQYISFGSVLRVVCTAVPIAYLVAGKRRNDDKEKPVDESLCRQRLRKFHPEPLIKRKIPTKGNTMVLKGGECVDLIRMDFLSLSQEEVMLKSAADTVKVYGTGTCGPRSFLGTTELHLQLEEKLPKLLNFEAALCYPYGPMTAYSVIGVCIFSTHTVFIDENANPWVKQSLLSRRCPIYYFKHNDASDLDNLVTNMLEHGRITKQDTLFLILEGIYEHDGTICNYPDLIQISRKYKMRVMIDESYSFGVLGETGLGIAEHFKVELNKDVDVMFANIEGTMGTIGGFSAAYQITVDQQNIFSAGFIYSASLPAFLIQGIITGLSLIGDRPIILQQLSRDVDAFLATLKGCFEVKSDPEVPVKVVSPIGVKDMHRDALLDKVLKCCEEEFSVYLLKDKLGVRFHLNYKLAANGAAQRALFSALKAASELVIKFQRY